MEHLQWLLVYLKQISEIYIFYKRQLNLNCKHSTKTIYLNFNTIDLLCNKTTENKLKTKQA